MLTESVTADASYRVLCYLLCKRAVEVPALPQSVFVSVCSTFCLSQSRCVCSSHILYISSYSVKESFARCMILSTDCRNQHKNHHQQQQHRHLITVVMLSITHRVQQNVKQCHSLYMCPMTGTGAGLRWADDGEGAIAPTFPQLTIFV